MRQKLSLKNENRGASLLAVLIILVVVSAIAVVITKITITNIQMKEVERGTKKNFYSAEEIMDNLRAGVAEKSADAMKTAYENVMQNYVVNKQSGKNLQEEFKKQYMKALEDTFWDKSTALRQSPKQDPQETSTDVVFSASNYNLDTLKACIISADTGVQSSLRTSLQTKSEDAGYEAYYKKGIFILKNIKIVYKDSLDYETTITTDLVLNTPEMNLTGGDQVKEFMKYSLIADKSINVSNVDSVKVGGNVYAGAYGIETSGSADALFNGRVVLTRGDIKAGGGTKLTIGNGNTSIWAENILVNGAPKETTKSTEETTESDLQTTEDPDPYTLSINGNCYVADDLSLQKANSRAEITGNYYGYNFQEDYDTANPSRDAQFSSAMMVNGRNSKLNLEGINYLMLAGRTFISRDAGGNTKDTNSDILMGESLAARTNQLAYYVPEAYLDSSKTMFSEEGKIKYMKDTGFYKVDSGNPNNESLWKETFTQYLNSSKQVVAYHYVNAGSSGTTTNYYLNFKDEQSANDFFAEYCSGENGKRGNQIRQYATKYLTEDAIILDKSRIFTLKGDIMYREKSNQSFNEQKVTIDDNKWTRTDSSMGVYFKYCSQLAVKYKALQLGLTESNKNAQVENVRIRDTSNKIDKTVSPLFSSLINLSALEKDIPVGKDKAKIAVDEDLDGTHHRAVILANNGSETYHVPLNITQGIVVATGDVCVDHNFNGLIISNGKITFASNVTVDADETMVVKLFADDLSKSTQEFSQYFTDYKTGGTITGILNGKIDVNTYLTYENWKKNN